MARSRDFSKQSGLPDLNYMTDAQHFDMLMKGDAAIRANQQMEIALQREEDRNLDADINRYRTNEAYERQEALRIEREENELAFEAAIPSLSDDPDERLQQITKLSDQFGAFAATSPKIKNQLTWLKENTVALASQKESQRRRFTDANKNYGASLAPLLSGGDRLALNKTIADYSLIGEVLPQETLAQFQKKAANTSLETLTQDVDFAGYQFVVGNTAVTLPQFQMALAKGDPIKGFLDAQTIQKLSQDDVSTADHLRWLASGGAPKTLSDDDAIASAANIGQSLKLRKAARARQQEEIKILKDNMKSNKLYARAEDDYEMANKTFFDALSRLNSGLGNKGVAFPPDVDPADREKIQGLVAEYMPIIDKMEAEGNLKKTQAENARKYLNSLSSSSNRIGVSLNKMDELTPPALKALYNQAAGGAQVDPNSIRPD